MKLPDWLEIVDSYDKATPCPGSPGVGGSNGCLVLDANGRLGTFWRNDKITAAQLAERTASLGLRFVRVVGDRRPTGDPVIHRHDSADEARVRAVIEEDIGPFLREESKTPYEKAFPREPLTWVLARDHRQYQSHCRAHKTTRFAEVVNPPISTLPGDIALVLEGAWLRNGFPDMIAYVLSRPGVSVVMEAHTGLPSLLVSMQRAVREAEAPIHRFGLDSQIAQCREECAELIVALAHCQRGKATDWDVAGEIADVMITVWQMVFAIGKISLSEGEVTTFFQRCPRGLDDLANNFREGLPSILLQGQSIDLSGLPKREYPLPLQDQLARFIPELFSYKLPGQSRRVAKKAEDLLASLVTAAHVHGPVLVALQIQIKLDRLADRDGQDADLHHAHMADARDIRERGKKP